MCGDDLTRENLLKQATNLNKVVALLLLPASRSRRGRTAMRRSRRCRSRPFDSKSWVPQGEIFNTDAAAGQ